MHVIVLRLPGCEPKRGSVRPAERPSIGFAFCDALEKIRFVLEGDPQLRLATLFSLDGVGRILSTQEPSPGPGPAFILIRGAAACAWAVRVDIERDLAEALDALAAREPAAGPWERPPLHAGRYQELLSGRVRTGPAFAFPERHAHGGDGSASSISSISVVEDEASLDAHFSGWVAGEIAAGRLPVMAMTEGGHPVSLCFCARRSAVAAEAGVETAAGFRGRGYATRVTAAWANAVRAMGLTPFYSTHRENHASLAVARKLRLVQFATDWSIG